MSPAESAELSGGPAVLLSEVLADLGDLVSLPPSLQRIYGTAQARATATDEVTARAQAVAAWTDLCSAWDELADDFDSWVTDDADLCDVMLPTMRVIDGVADVPDGDVSALCTAVLRHRQDMLAMLRLEAEVEAAAAAAAAADDDDALPEGHCLMCERQMPLTQHHLIPREKHRAYKKKGYTLAELNTCIAICRPCHSAIHRTYSNAELAEHWHSLERLLESPQLQKWMKWASRQRVSKRHHQQQLHYKR